MKVTAHLRNLRISPRKVRLVADLVRGKKAEDAVVQLRMQAKQAAEPVRKLIESAMANAEHNNKLNRNDLMVSEIFVNDAITMKRYMPRAFGRASVLRKRGSHVTVSVTAVSGSKIIEETQVAKEPTKSSKKVSGKTSSDKKMINKKESNSAVSGSKPAKEVKK
jgi:large subunit ribosomal protein L22